MKNIFCCLFLILLVVGCGDSDMGSGHKNHNSDKFNTTKMDMAAKDFTLTNQDGKRVSLSDFRGDVVAMTFIYTSCKNACPAFEKKFMMLQKRYFNRLGTDLHLLFVTVDPQRDTVEVLKKRSESIGADTKGWHFLTGSKEEVQKVLDDYLIHVETMEGTTDFMHPQRVYLIDKEGKIALKVGGLDYDDSVLKDKVGELL